jgi:methylase of polypeptide subunit release factors
VRDSHYTPTELADRLVSLVKKENVCTIADFCVGEGELLRAAKKKWTNTKCFGNDISGKTIQLLKKKYPDWVLEKCDFLNQKEKDEKFIFKSKFDIILLNPPFTCKGSTLHTIKFDGMAFHASTAMVFLVEAIKYLQKDGILYAILPQSLAYSSKDGKIRAYLREKYYFKILEELNNQSFEKCTPNIVLASVNDIQSIELNNAFKQIDTGIKHLQIQRGGIGMHNIQTCKGHSVSLIHSTNMRDNKIVGLEYKVKNTISYITGPALLIHRVGQPNIKKICIISSKETYALSDCVIGIKAGTIKDCLCIKKIITDNWNDFSNLYKGTGAKYITIERLKYFLNVKDDVQ